MDGLVENQYLTFSVDAELYAVGVVKVREVLEHTKITKLPRTADFMKGLINLRGTGVPVVDLRLKFGLPEAPVTKDTSIIVMELEGAEGVVVVGAIADAVHEVVELPAAAMDPAPKFGTRMAVEFIKGVGKKDGDFIIVLDIDRIFNADEAVALASATAVASEVPEIGS